MYKVRNKSWVDFLMVCFCCSQGPGVPRS